MTTKYRVENIKSGKLDISETINIIESIKIVKELKKVDILEFYGFINDIIKNFFDNDNIEVQNIKLFIKSSFTIILKFTTKKGDYEQNNYIVFKFWEDEGNISCYRYHFYGIAKNNNEFNLYSYFNISNAYKEQDTKDIKRFEELLKKEDI